jgi:pimeloyl-ACP methyl ester carboxylesterase
MHHGRFSLPTARGARAEPRLVAAMERLLTLAAVQAQSRVIKVAGLRLHYLEAGQGPPIVLLHGASGGSANWYRLMAPLACTHRVLALDLPGFGLSQALEPRAPLGVQVAELLEHWLDEIEVQRTTVLGTSFGGLVAVRLAQRAQPRICALGLLDSVGLGRELSLAVRLAGVPPLAALALRPSRWGVRWQFRELMVAQHDRLAPAHVDALLEYLFQSATVADGSRLARALALFADLRGQREVLTDDELRALRLPVLIIWGERDRFLPVQHGRRAAALVQGARLRIIPGAGHSPNWEAPEAVLECLSAFLRNDALS